MEYLFQQEENQEEEEEEIELARQGERKGVAGCAKRFSGTTPAGVGSWDSCCRLSFCVGRGQMYTQPTEDKRGLRQNQWEGKEEEKEIGCVSCRVCYYDAPRKKKNTRYEMKEGRKKERKETIEEQERTL